MKKVGQQFQVVTWQSGSVWLVTALKTPVATQGTSRENALLMIQDALESGYEIGGIQISDISDTPEGQQAISNEQSLFGA